MFRNFVKPSKWLLALGFVLGSPWASATPCDIAPGTFNSPCNAVFAGGWTIGAPDPIPDVTTPWTKILADPNPGSNVPINTMFTLTEHFALPAGTVSTSWTETIDPQTVGAGHWEWVSEATIPGGLGAFFGTLGPDTPAAGLSVAFNGASITFSFDPYGSLTGITDVDIIQELVCLGEACKGDITVRESIPEPGTLLLLGAGLAGFAGLRRRYFS